MKKDRDNQSWSEIYVERANWDGKREREREREGNGELDLAGHLFLESSFGLRHHLDFPSPYFCGR